eukprot:CAMPEP_0204251108 /NCGR_PEP_ID=MMETSP0361-20130328/100504_1 /ASSEMBLY_ACC=CAM_ASM_000343 /TAXON_ID=268821 /ORGANISM="Scrippsiella Hangoei, Strain SHTV-5" /LENGTH=317 /DNA_ID=CAMNT_0051224383 /DNA_START=152 /DNA_END=1105 /DNA_ORIENTATION=+
MTSATKATRMTMMTAQVQDIITTHRVDVREPLLRERLLAEFVGTFFLVMTVGIGVASGSDMAPVAIGLMLAVEIYTFGSVSGGFLNPAVTLAVVLGGRQKISCRNAALYMVAECLGGIAAGFAALAGTEKSFCFDYAAKSQSWGTGFELEMLFTMALCGIVLAAGFAALAGTEKSFCFDYAAKSQSWGTGFELEMLFTMALCGIVLSAGTSNDAPNQYFGFAIGCTVVAGARACGGFDQGSFNPAVTVGMNIANYANVNATQNPSVGAWFVFTLAPFVGGALAAGVFRGTRSNEFEEEIFGIEEMNAQASSEVKLEV